MSGPQEFYLASSSNSESGLGLLGLEMDWILDLVLADFISIAGSGSLCKY